MRMLTVTAVDPGPERSGVVSAWVDLDEPMLEKPWGVQFTSGQVLANDEVVSNIRRSGVGYHVMVVETIKGLFARRRGKSKKPTAHAGADQLAADRWGARIAQEYLSHRERQGYAGLYLQPTAAGSLAAVCGGKPDGVSRDTAIRRGMYDMFGGRKAALGTKASPGPLHGWTGEDSVHILDAAALVIWAFQPGGPARVHFAQGEAA